MSWPHWPPSGTFSILRHPCLLTWLPSPIWACLFLPTGYMIQPLSSLTLYSFPYSSFSAFGIFQDNPKGTLKSVPPCCCSMGLPQPCLPFLSSPICISDAVSLYHYWRHPFPRLTCTASVPRMLSGNNLSCTQCSVGGEFENLLLCPLVWEVYILGHRCQLFRN